MPNGYYRTNRTEPPHSIVEVDGKTFLRVHYYRYETLFDLRYDRNPQELVGVVCQLHTPEEAEKIMENWPDLLETPSEEEPDQPQEGA